MNIQYLIDSIVQQTTILIAQLATKGGVRAPLAHIANRVFLELTDELQSQGIGKKVSADMFGLALRSYRRKIQRLRESSTEQGYTLWIAIMNYLSEHTVVAQDEVLKRFRYDDEAVVRSVLHDMTESGIVFRSGHGSNARYRVATDEDLLSFGGDDAGRDALLLITIYRKGKVSREALVSFGSLNPDEVDASLERLMESGSITSEESEGAVHYTCERAVVDIGAASGWEAAVFDHFQAGVQTIIARLNRPTERSSLQDVVGGSTYTYDVWPSHPLRDEVLATISELRERCTQLRAKVDAFNATHEAPIEIEKVTFYFGQNLSKQPWKDQT